MDEEVTRIVALGIDAVYPILRGAARCLGRCHADWANNRRGSLALIASMRGPSCGIVIRFRSMAKIGYEPVCPTAGSSRMDSRTARSMANW